jgi:hypothetical protein
MSFSSTLAGGGGGAVTFISPLQEDSPATAIIVITRLRARVTRIDIDLISMVSAVFTSRCLPLASYYTGRFFSLL